MRKEIVLLPIISFLEHNKKRIIIYIILFFIAIFTVWLIWSNVSVQKTRILVSSVDLPDSFDGFKIAHISDLHNAEFGENNKRLLKKLRNAKPDIIAITGDSIDSRRTDMDVTLSFIEQAMEIAQCYFVVGNHEARIKKSDYRDFEEKLIQLGVIVLHNEATTIEKNNEKITIFGIDDPACKSKFEYCLEQGAKMGNYTVLLSHRPEYFEAYVENGYDLVLSGHAHGGQFRLPFIGGLYAPMQGVFPKYDSGAYKQDGTTMIVSRGLGNSSFPIRFNNRPELIIIELNTR